MSFFKSKYPIVAVGMNQVSTVELAIACHRAGIFPTISAFNNYKKNILQIEDFKKILEQYVSVTGTSNVIASMNISDFLNPTVLAILCDLKISHVELVDRISPENIKPILVHKAKFNKHAGHVIFKVLAVNDICYLFDGFIIKGPDGAGRSAPGESNSLETYFNNLKKIAPSVAIIPSGGISTSHQVKQWIDKGATAVGIGSLFAASKESPITQTAKEKLVNATSNDLKVLDEVNQLALVFTPIKSDGINNTHGLTKGVRTGSEGHLFIGRGVDQITKIISVNDIVQNLVKDL